MSGSFAATLVECGHLLFHFTTKVWVRCVWRRQGQQQIGLSPLEEQMRLERQQDGANISAPSNYPFVNVFVRLRTLDKSNCPKSGDLRNLVDQDAICVPNSYASPVPSSLVFEQANPAFAIDHASEPERPFFLKWQWFYAVPRDVWVAMPQKVHEVCVAVLLDLKRPVIVAVSRLTLSDRSFRSNRGAPFQTARARACDSMPSSDGPGTSLERRLTDWASRNNVHNNILRVE